MTLFKHVFTCIAFIFGLNLWCSNIFAYTLLGSKWPTGGTASFKVNTSGGPSYGLAAILAAMDDWNNVDTSSFEFYYAGTTSSRRAAKNGHNTAFFKDLGYNLGYCYYWYSWSTPWFPENRLTTLLEADIIINSNPVSCYRWNYNRLKGVVTHELGHALGLNHSSDPKSIMYGSVSDSRLCLSQDDINGITYLYPGVRYLSMKGDFNNDLQSDVLVMNESGEIYVYLMDGATVTDTGLVAQLTTDWQIKGVGDFNDDNKSDILLWNKNSGEIYVYLMDGATVTDSGLAAVLGLDWQIKGVGDFNNDNRSDILLWNKNSGDVSIYPVNGYP